MGSCAPRFDGATGNGVFGSSELASCGSGCESGCGVSVGGSFSPKLMTIGSRVAVSTTSGVGVGELSITIATDIGVGDCRFIAPSDIMFSLLTTAGPS